MKDFWNPRDDAEVGDFLSKLRILCVQAEELSKKADRRYVAVGKFWGVKKGLQDALDAAEREVGPREE